MTFAVAFSIGVTAAMLQVYCFPDPEFDSDYPDMIEAKENALADRNLHHVFRVFVPAKDEWLKGAACIKFTPSTLVVSIDKEGWIHLNDSDIGRLSDT